MHKRKLFLRAFFPRTNGNRNGKCFRRNRRSVYVESCFNVTLAFALAYTYNIIRTCICCININKQQHPRKRAMQQTARTKGIPFAPLFPEFSIFREVLARTVCVCVFSLRVFPEHTMNSKSQKSARTTRRNGGFAHANISRHVVRGFFGRLGSSFVNRFPRPGNIFLSRRRKHRDRKSREIVNPEARGENTRGKCVDFRPYTEQTFDFYPLTFNTPLYTFAFSRCSAPPGGEYCELWTSPVTVCVCFFLFFSFKQLWHKLYGEQIRWIYSWAAPIFVIYMHRLEESIRTVPWVMKFEALHVRIVDRSVSLSNFQKAMFFILWLNLCLLKYNI